MPIVKVNGGYRWGGHGTVYPTRAGAARQARAAYANGYIGKSLHESFEEFSKDRAARVNGLWSKLEHDSTPGPERESAKAKLRGMGIDPDDPNAQAEREATRPSTRARPSAPPADAEWTGPGPEPHAEKIAREQRKAGHNKGTQQARNLRQAADRFTRTNKLAIPALAGASALGGFAAYKAQMSSKINKAREKKNPRSAEAAMAGAGTAAAIGSAGTFRGAQRAQDKLNDFAAVQREAMREEGRSLFAHPSYRDAFARGVDAEMGGREGAEKLKRQLEARTRRGRMGVAASGALGVGSIGLLGASSIKREIRRAEQRGARRNGASG